MDSKLLPSPHILRQLIQYDPSTGKLIWLNRPESMFSSRHEYSRWNTRYSGKDAFTSVSSHGYPRGSINNQYFLAHRVIWAIMTDAWPDDQIDHIDGDRRNNRWENLRSATHAENGRNRKSATGSSSKYLGVYWEERRKKWRVSIQSNGIVKFGGYFECETMAAQAYDELAISKHGDFARLNFQRNGNRPPKAGGG